MQCNQSKLMLNPRQNSYLSLLDEKIIGKICDHLPIYDLLQFGELDVNYQRVIGDRIISKHPLVFSSISRHYDVRRMFKLYGEYSKEVCISECDIQYKSIEYTCIEEIFRLIKKYCTAEKLRSVHITLNDHKQTLYANNFLDVFADLNSLTINKLASWKRTEAFRCFLQKLLPNCKKLKCLKLIGIRCDSFVGLDFLMIPQMHDLQSLWLKDCVFMRSSWKKFINFGVRPLKTLRLENVRALGPDAEQKLQEIADAFPKLEKFYLFNGHSNCMIDTNFEAFTQLHYLKEVLILVPKYSNLIQSLASSCSQTLEKLAIQLNGTEPYSMNTSFLTSLRTVEFFDPTMEHITVYKSFMNLPQVIQCIFSAALRIHIDDVRLILFEIIKVSGHLQVLKVYKKHQALSSTFYKNLVQIRHTLFPNAVPLHLCAHFKRMKETQLSPKVIQICDYYNCQFFS